MPSLIATPQAITPAWLTACLRDAAHLPQGAVQKIALGEVIETNASFVTPLTVTYTSDAPESAPEKLVFKTARPGCYWGVAPEVILYAEIAAVMDNLAVPRHYYAVAEQTQDICALLVDDVSVSHERLSVPLPSSRPTRQELVQVVDELVKLHAHWWDHPFLAERLVHEQGGPLVMAHAATPDVVRRYGAQMADHYSEIAVDWGDALPSAWREICERAIEAWPDLMIDRINNRRGLTMIHGDFHIWNIFLPLATDADNSTHQGRPLILDWETFKRGIGPYDLAFLLIDAGLRQTWEQLLLKHYHEGLLAAGITGYTWADCLADYRLAIVANLFPPLNWRRIEALEPVIAAFAAWGCQELLG